jgi:hypothetical protein
MTTAEVTTMTTTRDVYLRLWRSVPRELGFLLLTLPIALLGFGVSLALFTGGVGSLAAFLIGAVFVLASLFVSRGFGWLELQRAASASSVRRGRKPTDRGSGSRSGRCSRAPTTGCTCCTPW